MGNKLIMSMGIGISLFVMILVLGVAFTSIMGYIARADTTTGLNTITVITNGTLTDFGSSYPYVSNVIDCINSSDATHTLNAANYTVVTGNSLGSGGFVLKDSGAIFVGEDVNCTVSYLKSTTASNGISALLVIFATIGGLGVLFVLVMIIKPFLSLMKKED